MKKILIILLLIACLVNTAQALQYGEDFYKKHVSAALTKGLNDPLLRFIREQEAGATSSVGTGHIFYVDSGVTSEGDGTTLLKAKNTLDEAVALCEDNRGDIIYVAQGHAETWIAADSADLDVIGISVIGLGTGTDRPTFTYTTGTAGELVIAALNVRICNLVFQPGIANVAHAIEIEGDADGSIIEFCEFLSGTTDAFEFVDAIQITAAADDLIIRFNKATETTAGAVSWLDLSAGVVDSISVYGNVIYGDYSTGIVDSTDRAQTLAYFGFNTMTNLSADDYGFYFNAAATGICEFNRIYTNAEATAIDPGSMACFENYVSTAVDVSGMITPVYDDGTTQLNATTVTAIAAAVDALDGIGMVGLVETNSGGATKVVCAALGGYGNDAFLEGWSLICTFDTGGAVGTAPSGEVRDVSDYVSTGGTFTVDVAFAAALTAGDYVLLIPTCLIPGHYGKIGSKTIYCDDGGSDGEGTNWQNAKITLAKAEAIAAVGDTILVGESHNENLGATDTLDVAGLTVIGMGEGDTRPLLDFDTTATELTLNAAGITLKNLRLRPGASVTVAAIVVGAAGLGVTIDNCAFEVGEASGDEFIDCIVPNAAAEGLTVKNCTAWNANATAGDSDTWLNLDGVTIDDCSVIGNTVFGTFDEACIWWGAAVPVNLLIKDNVLSNYTSGQLCIEGTGAATGMCVGNILYSDTYGSVLDPGSMSCVENYATNAINTSAYLVPSIDDELAEIGPGRIFYVDAGTPGAGDGRTWATAVATLDAGVNLCTTLRGDTIYVAAGHTEAVTTAFADLDLDNITVIGLGEGKSRPYFDYTGASGSMLINADNVTLRNIHFHANVDSTLIALTIQTGSENVIVEDCLFTTESATDEFDVCIDHAAANHGAVVRNCEFRMGAANAVSAIHFIDSDYAEISSNETSGDYSTACIHNETTASDHILIKDNELFNGTIGGGENTEPGIELFATTSGMIVGNNIVCLLTTPELSIVAADCYLFNNSYNGLESSNGGRGIGLVAGQQYAVTMNMPAAIDDDLFSVAGGPILITDLVGVCSTAIGAASTWTITLDHATQADTEFTDAVDVDVLAAGGKLMFSAANPSLMSIVALGANVGSSSLMGRWYCPVGMIEVVEDEAGTTGVVDWYMTFIPLVDGVTVTPQ